MLCRWRKKKTEKREEVRLTLFLFSSCESELSEVEQRRPAGLEKHSLVSQAGTFFVTWLKMCPNTIPITLHPLISPPWLPSLHLQRIACPLLKPFRLLGAYCSLVAKR